MVINKEARILENPGFWASDFGQDHSLARRACVVRGIIAASRPIIVERQSVVLGGSFAPLTEPYHLWTYLRHPLESVT